MSGDIEQQVKKLVVEHLSVDQVDVKNESSFADDLGRTPGQR
jgi:acyl carrier protein